MRPADVRNLIEFNRLTTMFIHPVDRSSVVAFLHGYEYGAGLHGAGLRSGRFTEAIKQHIAERYRIKHDSCGWPHQIERLAKRRSLDWIDAYRLVSSEILNAAIESTEGGA